MSTEAALTGARNEARTLRAARSDTDARATAAEQDL